MSDNKFIARLKGETTPKSVVEVQDPKAKKSFTGIAGTSDSPQGYSLDTASSVVVANGAKNWTCGYGTLTQSADYRGDGSDYTGAWNADGAGLWMNATYTFPASDDPSNSTVAIINPNAKWVLTLFGARLLSDGANVVKLKLVVQIGAKNIASKDFVLPVHAFQFCEQLAVDFTESTTEQIKVDDGTQLNVQLLCEDENAHAQIFSGMTVLTLLDRKIDARDVASDKTSFDDLEKRVATNAQAIDVIESKIPDNASPTNKMATAAEISNLQTQITSNDNDIVNLQTQITALDNDLQSQITSNDAEILKNTQDIMALKGAGGALTAYNFNTATPTQETLTKYAVDQIWPGNTNWAWNAANPAASTFTDASGVARTAAEIFNSTWVNNTYDDHRWQLTNTQNTTPKVFGWADVGRDIVSVATATTAGIVRVGDGSQMVVNASTGDISLDGSKAESIRGTIGAVATNQGTANAGKVMAVGVDGNLVPTPASASGLPIGAIVQYCGDTVPDNFMWCDGSAISRTTYASLFAVIGTKYGEGDDRSEFKLPNFNRVPPWGGAPDWRLGRGLSLNTNETLPYDGYLLVTNSKGSDGVIIWYSGRELMKFTPATTTGATNSRTMLIPFRKGDTIRVDGDPAEEVKYYPLKQTVPTEKWIIKCM